MTEVKETKDIDSVKDVEARIYHAFEVYKYLPPVKPQGYFNVFRLSKQDPEYAYDPRPVICNRDYDLAMEVCDVWWKWLQGLNSLETLEIIKYRCGAPIIKGGRQVYGWSGVRRWKEVGREFNIHRNYARIKWNKAIELLLENIRKNSASVLNCA